MRANARSLRRAYARMECPRAGETLDCRGARASLLAWAGALPRPWLPDSARVHAVKGARSKGGERFPKA